MGQNTLEAFYIHYQPNQTQSSTTFKSSDLLGSVIYSGYFHFCVACAYEDWPSEYLNADRIRIVTYINYEAPEGSYIAFSGLNERSGSSAWPVLELLHVVKFATGTDNV